MRLIAFVFAAALALPLQAQRINIDVPGLADKAVEVVDVTLDAQMLRLAAKFFTGEKGERDLRDMVGRLEGIYVRSYSFEKDDEYDKRIVDQVRRQLGPTWKKIVNVRKRGKENVEIFTDTRGDAITGLVVISAEPRELTLVNIVGPIDLEKLARLEGQFGIPRIDTEEEKRHDR